MTLPGATPFSAFNACKPAGPAILREEGDDAAAAGICEEGDPPRAEVQARLAAVIEDALRRRLPPVGLPPGGG